MDSLRTLLPRFALGLLTACFALGLAGAAVASTPTDEGVYSVASYAGEPYADLGTCELDPALAAAGAYVEFSGLDYLGRCGAATACLGPETLPQGERGIISDVTPSGWSDATYPFVDQSYLFNRCHLVAWSLCGEDANELNLVTGTRYMNASVMVSFEGRVLDYIRQTSNHVLYRVTPVYEGEDLVASGLRIEALSVEDAGAGVDFDVYLYNVQPGVTIDYATGESWLSASWGGSAQVGASAVTSREPGWILAFAAGTIVAAETSDQADTPADSTLTYIGNMKTLKFHYPWCDSVGDMKEKNKYFFYGTREEIMAEGYVPCKNCNP